MGWNWLPRIAELFADHRSSRRKPSLAARPGVLELEPRLAFSGIQAANANDFLNSLGVNTHIWQGEDSTAQVINMLQYTGIRELREQQVQAIIDIHNATGALATMVAGTNLSVSVPKFEQLAAAGALLAVEGPNEPNNFPVTYNGQSSAGTRLTTTAVAAIRNSAWFDTSYHDNPAGTRGYGPVGFKYGSGTAFVTGQATLGALRNDFTGWVGFKFAVGSSAITVNQLGRWVVSGNGGTHSVRLVRVSDHAVLGSVSVDTAGAPAGAFKYVNLGTPITLAANTAYYIMSQETNGSDQWYDGEQNFLPVAQFQSDLYATVQADPNLAGIPVFASSEAGGSEPNNVGLQFLTIPAGAGTLMPDGTQYADYANTHNYVIAPNQTALVDNDAWRAEAPGASEGPWDGMHVEYGVTWNKHFLGYADTDLVSLPKVTTETGWATQGTHPLSEDQQGKLFLNLYLDAFARGWSYTFIYMLHDSTSQGYWGLFHVDYTPKLSATYLSNLTTILADTVSLAQPDCLNYSIPGEPATVHDLLLEKSDGTFELAVWSELVSGTNNVTVNLGNTYSFVNLYDPTAGSSALQTLTNIDSVSLSLSDHPVIIEIPPSTGPRSRHAPYTLSVNPPSRADWALVHVAFPAKDGSGTSMLPAVATNPTTDDTQPDGSDTLNALSYTAALARDDFADTDGHGGNRRRANLGKGADKLAKPLPQLLPLQPEESIFQSTSVQFFPKN